MSTKRVVFVPANIGASRSAYAYMSRCVLWRRSSRKRGPARPNEPAPVPCVHSAKGLVLMKAAGRFASRKPVSNGPSRPGAVIINSLVTVVPPCARPVTIITGGRSSSATAAIRRKTHTIARRIFTSHLPVGCSFGFQQYQSSRNARTRAIDVGRCKRSRLAASRRPRSQRRKTLKCEASGVRH